VTRGNKKRGNDKSYPGKRTEKLDQGKQVCAIQERGGKIAWRALESGNRRNSRPVELGNPSAGRIPIAQTYKERLERIGLEGGQGKKRQESQKSAEWKRRGGDINHHQKRILKERSLKN